MAPKESLIDGVVYDIDSAGWDLEELFDLGAGELRYCENASRSTQHLLRHLHVTCAQDSSLSRRARHMVEHVVDRHDIRTRQQAWHGKKIRDMDQVAIQTLQRRAKFPVAAQGVFRSHCRNVMEIGR